MNMTSRRMYHLYLAMWALIVIIMISGLVMTKFLERTFIRNWQQIMDGKDEDSREYDSEIYVPFSSKDGYYSKTVSVGHTQWKNIPKCSHFKVKAAPIGTYSPHALVSFPGSGNTWLRKLIEYATGVYTGSLYEDPVLTNFGFYGEMLPWDSGSTIVQKTHGFVVYQGNIDIQDKMDDIVSFSGNGILLIRDLYNVLLSYRNHMSGGHSGYASNNQFGGEDWKTFVKEQTKKWEALHMIWLGNGRMYLPVYYEDLQIHLNRTMHRILQHLDIKPDENRMSCLLKYQSTVLKREPRGSQVFWQRDVFAGLHQVVDRAIEKVNTGLIMEGWPALPLNIYAAHRNRTID